MSQLTTHILDTTKGKPAQEVTVILFAQANDNWKKTATGRTNEDGRIPALLPAGVLLSPGVYKLRFEIQEYFDKQDIRAFYPFVEISFTVTGSEHYHVPLLLNPSAGCQL